MGKGPLAFFATAHIGTNHKLLYVFDILQNATHEVNRKFAFASFSFPEIRATMEIDKYSEERYSALPLASVNNSVKREE